jgi:hypothetical protein
MKRDENQPSLDEVIEAYMASTANPDNDSLSEWITRYPQYSRELMDFAAHWGLIDTLPPHEAPNQEAEEEALVSRGRSMFRDVWQRELKNQKAEQRRERPIVSLRVEAERCGMHIDQFTEKAELSPSIIEKLDQLAFDFSSIPQKVIENLARAIGHSFGIVALYLQGKTGLTSTARYTAGQTRRREESKEDFFEAIRSDQTMSEERRRKWLTLAPLKD